MADSSILEQQRRCHEERERLQDAMVREMLQAKKTVSALCLPLRRSVEDFVRNMFRGLWPFKELHY